MTSPQLRLLSVICVVEQQSGGTIDLIHRSALPKMNTKKPGHCATTILSISISNEHVYTKNVVHPQLLMRERGARLFLSNRTRNFAPERGLPVSLSLSLRLTPSQSAYYIQATNWHSLIRYRQRRVLFKIVVGIHRQSASAS